LPITYYLLPITYYLLPITYYLLPITYYLLPITYYLLPITYYLKSRNCVPHSYENCYSCSVSVSNWTSQQLITNLYTTTITQAEIMYGIAILPRVSARINKL
ncbi:hypothetical protein, partial [Moorena sp. SIO4E2]